MAVLTDPISDFLTRFKNAARAGNEEFTAPYSKIKADIARILQEEGYIWNFEVVTGERTDAQGQAEVHRRPLRSSPTSSASPLPAAATTSAPVKSHASCHGLGIAILSTSEGRHDRRPAKKQNLGGELLANVW